MTGDSVNTLLLSNAAFTVLNTVIKVFLEFLKIQSAISIKDVPMIDVIAVWQRFVILKQLHNGDCRI